MQPQAANAQPAQAMAEIEKLLAELEKNLESQTLSSDQQQDRLSRLKVLGRDHNCAKPISTKKGISILGNCGLDQGHTSTSREALRCLANALLLNEPSRQIFVDLGYAPKAAARLQVDNRDDEFLNSRLLFLLTYNTNLDFETLVKQQDLATSVNHHVYRHSKSFFGSSYGPRTADPVANMALAETMKLIFNITYYHSNLIQEFTPSIEPIVDILLHVPLPSPSLQPPITYLLNALLNLDLPSVVEKTCNDTEALPKCSISSSKHKALLDRLVLILDNSVRQIPESDLDQAAASLITLLRRLYELATIDTQSYMRSRLLPRSEDRDQPLGKGDTLASRLLPLSSSPKLPTLRENISNLLFELSDKDANKFVHNIGYGHASGFLMSHNIPIPAQTTESSAGVGDSGTSAQEEVINPVTGQRLAAEEAASRGQSRPSGESTAPDMTEEEREKEAERLYVLFERLRATGVVDVQNPVRQAMEEGRFEELND